MNDHPVYEVVPYSLLPHSQFATILHQAQLGAYAPLGGWLDVIMPIETTVKPLRQDPLRHAPLYVRVLRDPKRNISYVLFGIYHVRDWSPSGFMPAEHDHDFEGGVIRISATRKQVITQAHYGFYASMPQFLHDEVLVRIEPYGHGIYPTNSRPNSELNVLYYRCWQYLPMDLEKAPWPEYRTYFGGRVSLPDKWTDTALERLHGIDAISGLIYRDPETLFQLMENGHGCRTSDEDNPNPDAAQPPLLDGVSTSPDQHR